MVKTKLGIFPRFSMYWSHRMRKIYGISELLRLDERIEKSIKNRRRIWRKREKSIVSRKRRTFEWHNRNEEAKDSLFRLGINLHKSSSHRYFSFEHSSHTRSSRQSQPSAMTMFNVRQWWRGKMWANERKEEKVHRTLINWKIWNQW